MQISCSIRLELQPKHYYHDVVYASIHITYTHSDNNYMRKNQNCKISVANYDKLFINVAVVSYEYVIKHLVETNAIPLLICC